MKHFNLEVNFKFSFKVKITTFKVPKFFFLMKKVNLKSKKVKNVFYKSL